MKTTLMHTPGPWIAVPNGEAFNLQRESARHHAILVGMNYNKPGELEANARLIAAAPELLEALEAMTGWAHHGEESDPFFFSAENAPSYQADDAKAMALIKKLRGEK
jgi:hypothetical protein